MKNGRKERSRRKQKSYQWNEISMTSLKISMWRENEIERLTWLTAERSWREENHWRRETQCCGSNRKLKWRRRRKRMAKWRVAKPENVWKLSSRSISNQWPAMAKARRRRKRSQASENRPPVMQWLQWRPESKRENKLTVSMKTYQHRN